MANILPIYSDMVLSNYNIVSDNLIHMRKELLNLKVLELKDVHYSVDNTEILKGISAEVYEGDCISLIGSSGSGKSTLLKICADLLPLSKGSICYRGVDYSKYNPIELRQQISYILQLPYLFGKKVLENLEFPFKARGKEMEMDRVVPLLNEFGLDENILYKDVNSLSGGEKQRVSIIRNLIYTPDVLLLDESTSALDSENALKIERYIANLNSQGTTILWITHSIEQSVGIFNKRMTLHDGKIQNLEVLK